MSLFRIVGFCLLICNFQLNLASGGNPYSSILRSHGSFYCLDQAAKNQNVVIFKRFLEAGADKYALRGGTSVMTAVIQRGWPEGVKALIDHGYVINISDTPVRSEDRRCCRVLNSPRHRSL